MLLKQVELYGFKSFCEKTILRFSEGVTAIVGPNGAGKTNLLDSVKWVLGEQNPRELRGLEMEDVIFNGTSDVPPLGFTEVALLLDNSRKIFPLPYEEILITRRLYRSGESEYLINKVPVRLKDIAELFMGTGIGTSAYSIMEQGKMDQILSAKPEERRVIFEEASGITKYKVKKKEAMRKLEQTEENLTRVRDIIVEVRRQVNSIERQVSKAQKYQTLFEQMKTLEVGLGAHQYRLLFHQKERAEKERLELETELQKITQSLGELTERMHSLRQELESHRNLFEEKEKEWKELEALFQLNQEKISLEQKTQKEWRLQQDQLFKESAMAQERIRNLMQQFHQAQADGANLFQEQALKEGQLLELEQQLSIEVQILSALRENSSKTEQRLSDWTVHQSRLKNEQIGLQTQRQGLLAQWDRLEQDRQRIEQEIQEHQIKIAQLKEKEMEFDQRIFTQQQLQTQQGLELEKLHQEQSKRSGELHQLETRQSTLITQIQFLEDLRSRYEGFSEGVRKLFSNENRDILKIKVGEGIIGVIANLIRVEPGYEQAVESALGEHIQTILVDRVETAMKIMELTTRMDIGKVILLPLEWVPYPANGSFQDSATENALVHYVHCPESYRAAIEYLLRETYWVDSLDPSKETQMGLSDAQWVTREGHLIRDCFWVSPGTILSTHPMGLLARENRIHQLKTEQEEAQKQLSDLTMHYERVSEQLKVLEEWKLDQLKLTRELEKELSVHQLKLSDLERRVKDLLDEQKGAQNELENLRTAKGSLDQVAQEVDVLIEEISTDCQKEHQSLAETKELITVKERGRENLSIQIAQIKAEVSAVIREAEKQKEIVVFLQETLLNEQESERDRQARLVHVAERITRSELTVQELEEQTKSWSSCREEFQTQLLREREEQNQMEQERRSLEERSISLQQEKMTFQDQQHRIGIELQESTLKMEHLLDRLRNSYQVEANHLDEVQLQCSLEEAEEQLEPLRAKLQQMGSVNLAALEEHQELAQRLQFLTTQEQDLVNARESLISAIQKINRTTRGLFKETFEKIQNSFQEFFSKLFRGGQTQLVLMDEEDILESGIEILARPPGKKLQNISLLSGGERALTAIALLFALFKIKPSPFCILDEIDAPLDEANIDRFCEVLKEFTQESQFLIITHNKKTMQIADTFYGVTMERAGISKVISVKLTKEPQEPEAVLTATPS